MLTLNELKIDNNKAIVIGNGYEIILINTLRKNLLKLLVKFTDVNAFNKGIDLVLEIDDESLKNGKVFYTDSNGLFEMKRIRKEKWENSVYPCNSYWYIQD